MTHALTPYPEGSAYLIPRRDYRCEECREEKTVGELLAYVLEDRVEVGGETLGPRGAVVLCDSCACRFLGYVYFVQAERGGPVKIGVTDDLDRRLSMLQASSAERLVVIYALPGDRRTELELHKRFSEHRIRGEWFAEEPVLEWIEDRRAYGFQEVPANG